MKMITLLLLLGLTLKAYGQKELCDTSKYFVYKLRANTVSPKFKCDAFILSQHGFDRFHYLNEEYLTALQEGIMVDSLYSTLIDSFQVNTRKMKDIYALQKKEIEDFEKVAVTELEASMANLASAKIDLSESKKSIDDAIHHIKKNKWLHIAIGFAAGAIVFSIAN